MTQKFQTELAKEFARGYNTETLKQIAKEMRVHGELLRAEGRKLYAEGDKLRAEGDKLRAEGNKLWAEGDNFLKVAEALDNFLAALDE